MVEIFKTNVEKKEESFIMIQKLQTYFPGYKINFDLDDCDRILRIEYREIPVEEIIGLLGQYGYQCEVIS